MDGPLNEAICPYPALISILGQISAKERLISVLRSISENFEYLARFPYAKTRSPVFLKFSKVSIVGLHPNSALAYMFTLFS